MSDIAAIFISTLLGAFVVFVAVDGQRRSDIAACEKYMEVPECIIMAVPADPFHPEEPK